MVAMQLSEKDRQEIEELIPWRVAGTLSSKEAARVDAAVAADPDLARSYEEALQELGADIEINEAVPVPSGRMMSQLFARIDAEPVRPRALSLDLGRRLSDFVSSLSPKVLAWSAAAAALVIVAQAGVIGGQAMQPKTLAGAYQTASAPGEAALSGAIMLVRFKPGATAAQIESFLEARHASIVAGPAGGFYKVRVSPRALPAGQLADLAAAAQKDPAVAFAAASQ